MKRADVLASLRRDDADEALAQAEQQPSDDPLDRAVLLRARGFLERDPKHLLKACEILDRYGYAFEAARTRWLLGGESRDQAKPVLERLGAVPPAEVEL